jgi:hypothetical protein
MKDDLSSWSADDDQSVGYGRPPKKDRFKPGHIPHKKKCKKKEGDLLDIARSILIEPRKARTPAGKIVRITTLEGAFRLDIQRAIAGDNAAIIRWVRLLMKHPKLSQCRPDEIIYFIN